MRPSMRSRIEDMAGEDVCGEWKERKREKVRQASVKGS